jgi:hypothetical protein
MRTTRIFLLSLISAVAASAATITTYVTPSTIHVGDTFDVGVQFTSDGMYGYQFDVLFPSFLQANSVSAAGFFDAASADTFYSSIDNSSTFEISGLAAFLSGTDPGGGVSCAGGTLFCATDILATINFTALSAGTGTLDFDLVNDAANTFIITDPNTFATDPDATFTPASITVQNSSSAVPEPGTVLLVAGALAAAIGFRRATPA